MLGFGVSFLLFLNFFQEVEREAKMNKLLIKEVLCFIHSNLMWQGSVTGCVKLRVSGWCFQSYPMIWMFSSHQNVIGVFLQAAFDIAPTSSKSKTVYKIKISLKSYFFTLPHFFKKYCIFRLSKKTCTVLKLYLTSTEQMPWNLAKTLWILLQ